jgi:hypothetical protein
MLVGDGGSKRKPKPWPPSLPGSQNQEDEEMKLSQAVAIAVLGVANTLAACGAESRPQADSTSTLPDEKQVLPVSKTSRPANQEQPHETASGTSQSKPQNASKDNLEIFLPKGATLLSSAVGDLNGDGRIDAAIVADPARTGKEFAGDGPSRIVMLLIRNENGQLKKTLVPCAKCGGMAGDPFEFLQVKASTFVVVVSGGSPSSRWSEVYEFYYESDLNDWILRSVDRGVSDRIDGQVKQEILTKKDLGIIRFQDLDRSTLPPSPTF